MLAIFVEFFFNLFLCDILCTSIQNALEQNFEKILGFVLKHFVLTEIYFLNFFLTFIFLYIICLFLFLFCCFIVYMTC